jgi:hypothetical protein
MNRVEKEMIPLANYPELRMLAWSFSGQEIEADRALSLYERNWHFIREADLTDSERALIQRLKDTYGNGVLNV